MALVICLKLDGWWSHLFIHFALKVMGKRTLKDEWKKTLIMAWIRFWEELKMFLYAYQTVALVCMTTSNLDAPCHTPDN